MPLLVPKESELANRPAEIDFDQLAGFDVLLGGKAGNGGGTYAVFQRRQDRLVGGKHHRDIQIWHDQIQYKPPHHGGINNWHQDAPYWPVLKPETPVTAWIALDDVDESNGCMWMVPGSHKWGNNIEMLQKNPQ